MSASLSPRRRGGNKSPYHVDSPRDELEEDEHDALIRKSPPAAAPSSPKMFPLQIAAADAIASGGGLILTSPRGSSTRGPVKFTYNGELFTKLPSDCSSHVLTYLPLRELINLIFVSKSFHKICDNEDSWAVRLRSRYPDEEKPVGVAFKQYYIQKHTRTFGPVIEMLQKFAPIRILTQGVLQHSLNQIIHPPEEISGVLRQSSRLRKMFRERQQIVSHLIQLNANLHKIPGIFAQSLMVIVCESVYPEFFNYPYLGYALDKMWQLAYLKLMMFSVFVLGIFPSVVSIMHQPLAVIQSNDVYRWILFDEMMYRIIKEVCLRWISLCMIMVAAVATDALFAYVHPCVMVYFTFRDVIRGLRTSGFTVRLMVHCFANVLLIFVVWDIHWVFELCSAMGQLFHLVTFNAHRSELIGPDWSQRLFAFSIFVTILLPDGYYFRKLASAEELSQVQDNRRFRITSSKFWGWFFSFLDSQLMIYATLRYGLLPGCLISVVTGFAAVTAQYSTAQVVKCLEFCPASLRDSAAAAIQPPADDADV